MAMPHPAPALDRVHIHVDGRTVRVPAGTTLAAALLDLGVEAFRRSVHGAPRAPLCGIGVCFECRVAIDGVPQRRACLAPVRDGMTVVTGGGGGDR